jgi:hypothetical protein
MSKFLFAFFKHPKGAMSICIDEIRPRVLGQIPIGTALPFSTDLLTGTITCQQTVDC